jgi:riboflavin kinase / FMN adenylyltransferase
VEVISDLSSCPWPGERAVITIGAYDGVHLGHQTVISEVRRMASALDARSVVVTFDRHPASVVRPESAPKLLTDLAQKLELLGATGIDAVVVVPFDEERSQESAEDFVRDVLVDCLQTRLIVVGEDFHFGHQRRGNVAFLREIGADLDFDVEPLGLIARPDGVVEAVSSTAIRRALHDGDVELAARLLGRPFEARGIVADGDQRGRLIGFPTANVRLPASICLPADGVYAGWYERPDGQIHPCVMNLGRRPTFYETADASLLEVHLIDFSGDLYGESASVRFTHLLRPERKFDGIEEIRAQLMLDVEHARQMLS